MNRRVALSVTAVFALLVTCWTLLYLMPLHALPVGVGMTEGPSMNYDHDQIVVYADIEPDIGDPVVYEGRDEYGDSLPIHHRVVDHTTQGYVTQGDAWTSTDQSWGQPYVTDENLYGVVVYRVSVPAVWNGLIDLLVVLVPATVLYLLTSLTARRPAEAFR